jgi:hypothetical protein
MNFARAERESDVVTGDVVCQPIRSLWVSGMLISAVVGSALTFGWAGVSLLGKHTP